METVRKLLNGAVLSAAFIVYASVMTGIMPGAGYTAENDITITNWGGDAEAIYDSGFMHMLKKSPGGGVSLFDMDLIENDGPGAGDSEKGVDKDEIWGDIHARKILNIDDIRARKAYLVVYNYQQGKTPLTLSVNGKKTQMKMWDTTAYYMSYMWCEFPVEWLKKGKNVIDMSCPEAKSQEDGWVLYLSRADEFEAGGGNPADVGKTSFKSFDGGETWKESPFGPLGNDRAEYSVRLSFDRYVKSGWLATPVVDLWRGDSDDFSVKQHMIKTLTVSIEADEPEGSSVEFFIRKGTNPSPFSDEWAPYELIGRGKSVTFEAGTEFNRRYIQIRAELSTTNPLVSPVVKSIKVRTEFKEHFPVADHTNIAILDVDNPVIKYSSINWEWEKWDRPEFKELRERENLDEFLAGCQTEFEAQVKLLDYASTRWNWTTPQPEYPEWDAMSIVKRINKAGGGGMCIQHNNFLGGMCMAFGWQARLANIDGHEICEVWNDEFGKWIYIDASYNHYIYDSTSMEPANVLDMHRRYLEYFYSGKSIDWPTWKSQKYDLKKDDAGLRRGTICIYDRNTLGGFMSSAFVRYVPRNNWYEKPWPRPVSHGNSLWPWTGYVNWYDDRTPPKRQYAWYTDRQRDLYPDLNTVHIHATSGPDHDKLYLQFETYTPNFSHFEVDANGTGWKKTGEIWTWFLRSGRNTVSVRAVSKMGVKGKPSSVSLNFGDAQFVPGLK